MPKGLTRGDLHLCKSGRIIIGMVAGFSSEWWPASNRNAWPVSIGICTLGEDRYTNRSDHAPANVFTLLSGALALLKRISKSPTKAIETVQDHRDKAITFLTKDINASFL